MVKELKELLVDMYVNKHITSNEGIITLFKFNESNIRVGFKYSNLNNDDKLLHTCTPLLKRVNVLYKVHLSVIQSIIPKMGVTPRTDIDINYQINIKNNKHVVRLYYRTYGSNLDIIPNGQCFSNNFDTIKDLYKNINALIETINNHVNSIASKSD